MNGHGNMAKAETTTLYVRIPVHLKALINQKAADEGRTIAVTTARLLEHALMCNAKVIKDEY